MFIDGQEVNLTAKEFDVLELLAMNQDKVYSREQLLKLVWGYDYPGDARTVDVHIRTLRQKLGNAGDRIETVRGVELGETIKDAAPVSEMSEPMALKPVVRVATNEDLENHERNIESK